MMIELPRIFRTYCTCALAWFAMQSLPIAAGADVLPDKIDRLVNRVIGPGVQAGITVADLASRESIYQHNSDVPLIPGSNQKILLMGAALEMLGPGFEFRTVLALQGDNLVVIGDGDPAIGDPRICKELGVDVTDLFEQWSDKLRTRGITTIGGNLILDGSIFDDQRAHPTWTTDDLFSWYAAPVGALNLNDNCIDLTAWPAEELGKPPIWSLTTPNSIVKIINRAKSATKGVPVIARRHDTFTFVLSGKCGKRATLASAPVPDPEQFFGHCLRTILKDNGVSITGEIRRGRVRRTDGALPTSLETISTHQTKMESVLKRIGKNSQNLFAECLAKRMGYEYSRRYSDTPEPGSWALAGQAMTKFVRNTGADITGMKFADASGLSRANRATSNQLTQVLMYVHGQSHGELLRNCLPIAGEDGSLRRRMIDIKGRVIAKTGTLRGVKSLSGYIKGPNGIAYAFSIIINNFKGPSRPYRDLCDDLCRLLAAQLD